MKQVQEAAVVGMTSRSSAEYSCSECKDTGWVETGNKSFKRCKCIELKFIKECWKNYGVKPEEVKTLQEYIPVNKTGTAARQKTGNYITSFSQLNKKENNWLGLFGQSGSGKSHLMIAIGAALLNRKDKAVRAVYMPYLEAMRELKVNVLDDEYYLKLLSRYQKAELLLIDDLFKDKVKRNRLAYDLSEVDIKHIYPIINYRYFNKLPTIISSECTPNMLLELDDALGGRILERCDENITVFVGAENNYRLRKFEKG